MRHALYLTLILFLSLKQYVHSQAVDPFPVEQRTLWQQGDKYILYYAEDGLDIGNGQTQLALNRPSELAEDSCWSEVIEESYPWHLPRLEQQQTSLVSSDQRIWPTNRPTDYLLIEPARSWTTPAPSSSEYDRIEWRSYVLPSPVEVLSELLDLTELQGVRYANNGTSDTVYMQLHDTLGFVQYLPFTYWWEDDWPVLRIAGLERPDGLQLGFTHRFENYFTTPVGSIYKYEGTPCPGYCYFLRRDSVLNLRIEEEGAYLTVARQQRNDYFEYIFENDEFVLTRSELEISTAEEFFPRDPERFEYLPGALRIEDEETVTLLDTLIQNSQGRYQTSSQLSWRSPEDCGYVLVDNFCSPSYTLLEGAAYSFFRGYRADFNGCVSYSLIGYQVEGQRWGDIAALRVLSNQKAVTLVNDQLSLSPNPGNQALRLTWQDSSTYPELQVKIINIKGELIWQQAWATSSESLQLRTTDWPVGVYTVQLNNGNQTWVKRWVKQ